MAPRGSLRHLVAVTADATLLPLRQSVRFRRVFAVAGRNAVTHHALM
jgi:hypothetical protein